MGYPYESGDSSTNAKKADDVHANQGACPPLDLEYRIYPEYDFIDLFEYMPASIKIL